MPRQARAARQPRPAKPACAPKPVRLRGRRFSVQPRIAAPWLLPFTIKGNLATVTVHQGGIHIERGAGMINGNRSADIPWHQLAGIDFLDPSFFRNGHAHFATHDDPRGHRHRQWQPDGRERPEPARHHVRLAPGPCLPPASRPALRQLAGPVAVPAIRLPRSRGALMSTTPPGWYADNYNPGFLRWWDGAGWTEHTQPAQRAMPAYTAPGTVPTYALAANPVPSVQAPAMPAQAPAAAPQPRLPGSKRDLQGEVERLRQVVDSMGVEQLEQLRSETRRLQDELPRLRYEEAAVQAALGPLRAEAAQLGAFQAQVASLRAEVTHLQAQRDAMAVTVREIERLDAEMSKLRIEHAELSRTLVETREAALLQEAGVYQYRHPLNDAVDYKVRLTGLQARIKDAVRAGTAVQGATNWTVNGSSAQGAKMVRELSKLMLRAYNNEADHAVSSMKPYTLDSSVARLEKSRETITRLGGTMNIRVTDSYHRLRVEELQLTSDYLAKAAEEKSAPRKSAPGCARRKSPAASTSASKNACARSRHTTRPPWPRSRARATPTARSAWKPSSPRSRTRSTGSTAAPPTSAPGTCT